MSRLMWARAVAPWAVLGLALTGCADDGGDAISAPTLDERPDDAPGDDPNPQPAAFDAVGAPTRPEQGVTTPRPARPAMDDGVCVSNLDFFRDEVWAPVLSQGCFQCHNALGAARQSGLVFQAEQQSDFLEHNLAVFAEVASYERDGVSVVLLKPTARIEHGGGQQLTVDDPGYRALEAMVGRLDNPVECDPPVEPLDEGFFEGVAMLNPSRTLRKATLSLAGRLPSDEETLAVEQGGVRALEAILDRVTREEGFYQRVMEIWADILLTDKYLGGRNAVQLLDTRHYPHARWYYDENYDRSGEDPRFVAQANRYANDSVAREPLWLIRHVLEQELPFSEILTADYTILNPYSARVYGVTDALWRNPLDPDERQALQIPGVPHAGVLTSPMVLNRFPTTDTNRNRHRALKVFDIFLATDILALGERPIDPTSAVHNPTLNDPQCTSCHAALDPLAGAFQNWDTRGSYLPRDSWYEGMRAPGFADEEIDFEQRAHSLQWLGRRLTADERFSRAMARVMFRALTGREPLTLPGAQTPQREAALVAYEAQQAFIKQAADDFSANGDDLRRLIKAIVRSGWFRADNFEAALDPQRADELAHLGIGRRLSPEQLHQRILATFDIPWRANLNSRDLLLDPNQYRILYGGIDYDDVIERLEDPNGIMAAIQQFMANDVSCRNVALDFAYEPEQRVLFPHVEVGYMPEDANGFEVPMAVDAIRRNIQHLHQRILGEELAQDDPELDRTYQLFYDTWQEGLGKIRRGERSASLLWQCQGRVDFWTSEMISEDRRVMVDPYYTVRAWRAVVSYLLMDYRFLYD